jgi:hypothetical protein
MIYLLNTLECYYFALASSHRHFFLLTESDLLHCNTGSVPKNPNNVALYDVQVVTFVSILYFQGPNSYRFFDGVYFSFTRPLHCKATKKPGSTTSWSSARSTNIRFQKDRECTYRNVLLSDAVFIYNASTISISSNKIRTLPELHRAKNRKLMFSTCTHLTSFPLLPSMKCLRKWKLHCQKHWNWTIFA